MLTIPWKTLSIASRCSCKSSVEWHRDRKRAKEKERRRIPLTLSGSICSLRLSAFLPCPLPSFTLLPLLSTRKSPSFCACGISFLLPDWPVVISSSSSSSFPVYSLPSVLHDHVIYVYVVCRTMGKVRGPLWTRPRLSSTVETSRKCVRSFDALLPIVLPSSMVPRRFSSI